MIIYYSEIFIECVRLTVSWVLFLHNGILHRVLSQINSQAATSSSGIDGIGLVS